eukprot:1176520-Prorocentrum_minimum.AAC.1
MPLSSPPLIATGPYRHHPLLPPVLIVTRQPCCDTVSHPYTATYAATYAYVCQPHLRLLIATGPYRHPPALL